MRPILVFDVNETLLDLTALDPSFEAAFGNASARREWFGLLLRMSMQATILGQYSDFGVLAAAALDALAAARTVELTETQRAGILGTMRALPPHADVLPALHKLRNAGWRMVALTNSSPAMAASQLDSAGIEFERIFTVDAVKKFKPSPEVYLYVASELAVPPSDLLMVAAHAWDVAGAMNAGLQGAFLARPGQVLDALTPPPSHIARDLNELATRLV